jgi:hypothetical protein
MTVSRSLRSLRAAGAEFSTLASKEIVMAKAKSGIVFPQPKGPKGQPMPAQDPKRRPQMQVARVVPRTKASTKGR